MALVSYFFKKELEIRQKGTLLSQTCVRRGEQVRQ